MVMAAEKLTGLVTPRNVRFPVILWPFSVRSIDVLVNRWYAHLKDMSGRPWFIAALVSWGVALAEYLLQVPANRIGYTTMHLGQLKILQEVIAPSVFVPFAVLSMKQPLKLNYLWAALCICAAVSIVFREA